MSRETTSESQSCLKQATGHRAYITPDRCLFPGHRKIALAYIVAHMHIMPCTWPNTFFDSYCTVRFVFRALLTEEWGGRAVSRK